MSYTVYHFYEVSTKIPLNSFGVIGQTDGRMEIITLSSFAFGGG